MTDKDIDKIASRISEKMMQKPCQMGFDHDEVKNIKTLSKVWDIVTGTALKVTVTIIVTTVIGWIAVGFYMRMKG